MSANWKDRQHPWGRGADLATHFCGQCTALRAEDDAECADCAVERPASGWPPLGEAFDPFLGRVLLDRYLINKVEGHGASSTVYRAESLTVPKRFAVKMVKLGYADKEKAAQARERLEREVRAVGMLRSPHIVRVYEMLEVDANWVALIMDHIDGETLDQRVERDGALGVDQACGLLRQVANGLCEAHQSGMIHRDIKPENIMLERLPDGSDFAYLLDFGVVRLQDEARMTQGFVGTPLYASPEQAMAEMGVSRPASATQGDRAQVDFRSDIYSLGATFYFMLTGRAPFERKQSVEVLKAHLQQAAPTLAEAAPGVDFPADVEALVARMLAKAPGARPSNLFKVIDALTARENGYFGGFSSASASSVSESHEASTPLAPESDLIGAKNPGTSGLRQRLRHDSATLVGQSPALDEFSDAEPPKSPVYPARRARTGTSPGQRPRPQTNPPGMSAATLERLQRRTAGGHAFARSVRHSGAGSEQLVALVDSHNEIWALGAGRLRPVCAPPASRVCSVTTSTAEAFVGLHDGTINRVDPAGLKLSRLFPTQADLLGNTFARPGSITALAATPAADMLLAGTSSGALLTGRAAPSGDKPRGDEYTWTVRQNAQSIQAVALSDRGDLCAWASIDYRVRVATSDAPDSTLASFDVGAPVIDMAFSKDDDLLAVLVEGPTAGGHRPGRSAHVLVYQVLAGQKLYQFTLEAPLPRNLYFSAQNALHGVCAAHGRIGRWNLMTDRAVVAAPNP